MKITREKIKTFLFWTVVIVVPGGSLLLISKLRKLRTLMGKLHEELNKHQF